jgi:hypothetical protein
MKNGSKPNYKSLKNMDASNVRLKEIVVGGIAPNRQSR